MGSRGLTIIEEKIPDTTNVSTMALENQAFLKMALPSDQTEYISITF